MSEIKNGGLDQYGAEPFEQQQFRTAGVEGVKKFVFSLGLLAICSVDNKSTLCLSNYSSGHQFFERDDS